MRATCPSLLILLELIVLIMFGEEYRLYLKQLVAGFLTRQLVFDPSSVRVVFIMSNIPLW
jgi:hypothetical protein